MREECDWGALLGSGFGWPAAFRTDARDIARQIVVARGAAADRGGPASHKPAQEADDRAAEDDREDQDRDEQIQHTRHLFEARPNRHARGDSDFEEEQVRSHLADGDATAARQGDPVGDAGKGEANERAAEAAIASARAEKGHCAQDQCEEPDPGGEGMITPGWTRANRLRLPRRGSHPGADAQDMLLETLP